MRRFATIDVGSNSVLLYVAERNPDGVFVSVLDSAEVTRLAEGLNTTARFAGQAMSRTLRAVCNFKRMAEDRGIQGLAAVGTHAFRKAENSGHLVSMIKERCGVDLEVITGREEAGLAFTGAMDGLPDIASGVVMVDVGGGSTEFVYGSKKGIERSDSLDVGALTMTERFLTDDPPLPEQIHELTSYLESEFLPLDGRSLVDTLVGIGGTVTTMCAVKLGLKNYSPSLVHASVLTRKDVEAQIKRFVELDSAARSELPGLDRNRAEIITAGSIILVAIMDRLGTDRLLVSDHGVRHGLMLKRFR